MSNKYGYKKYMKKESRKSNSLLQIFLISFFAMLLVFTFIFKSCFPSADTTIGDYAQEQQVDNSDDMKKIVDDRLSMIQNEDREKSFTDTMQKAIEDEKRVEEQQSKKVEKLEEVNLNVNTEPIYKVFVGAYTSVEQAKVAKEIIQESGVNLNPIVKCIGSNNYTLQVGIFKSKQGAEALLNDVQKSHLPGRIVQDY